MLELLGPDPEVRDLAPLLNPVLGLELPETAASAELSGQGRAGRTRDLLVRLLRAGRGDPDRAGDRGRPLAGLGLDRAGAGPQPGADAAAAGGGHPLPGEAGRSPTTSPGPPTGGCCGRRTSSGWCWTGSPRRGQGLVGQRLGAASVPDTLARLVESKAEGNPLFTEELTIALREAELVRVVGGRVELASEVADVLARRMPQTVHGAITSRIDRLSPTQQLTVKVASVIGRVFAVVILREIHPLREAVARTLTADLSAIEQANLTVLETPEPDSPTCSST